MSFVCPICQKSFSTNSNRTKHVVSIHKKSDRFKCKNCDKRFYNEFNLKSHEIIHTGKKPFGCGLCQKRFNRKGNLKFHYLNIHAEKKFKCETCGMGFGRDQGLKKHLVTHSKEKPFQCEDCTQRFSCKNYLQKHLKVHSKDKSFRYDQCEYSSNRKANLRKNLAIHSTNRRETSRQRRLARDNDPPERAMRVEQSVGSDGSSGSKYNLRVRRKTSNSRVDQAGFEADKSDESTESRSSGNSESRSNHQDSDDKPSEPNEESGREDELVHDGDEDSNKEQASVLFEGQQNGDEDYPGFDEPTESNESRPSKEYEMITLSSDDGDGELSPESSTMASANLMLVYDVEYRAPD